LFASGQVTQLNQLFSNFKLKSCASKPECAANLDLFGHISIMGEPGVYDAQN